MTARSKQRTCPEILINAAMPTTRTTCTPCHGDFTTQEVRMKMFTVRVLPMLAAISGMVISLPAAALSVGINTEDSDRAAGDIIQIALPAIAFGTALYKDDREGMKEWAYSFGSTMLATAVLKKAVNPTAWGERPNGGKNSFPSGHTSSACSGASFIGQRYGWNYGGAAMLPAAFVAYSRVDERMHHWRDVIAGCVIGIGFSYYFVQPEHSNPIAVIPEIGDHSWALGFQMKY